MKLKLFLLVLFAQMLSMTVYAYDADINGIYYDLNSDGTAVVTRGPNGYPGYVIIPASVSCNGKNYNVTIIGDGAFDNRSTLTSVTIPNSVTSIGDYAFRGCSGLTSVTIPESVTSIGDSSFDGCSGLTSVTIPNSVASIGDWAFHGCSGLASVTIGGGVTSIGKHTFSWCSGLTSITIPKSVTNIGEYAFSGCSGLTSITIPDGVTSIDECTFAYCSSLISIIIPNSISIIGNKAFSGCSSLITITIPESVTSIGGGAFYGCSGLTSITIPESVTSISNSSFMGCDGLTTVTINCPIVGDMLFEGFTSIKEVTLGGSVTNISHGAFKDCSNLTSITIPNSVTSIGNSAFSGCSGLTSVTIPESVTSISDSSFSGCSGLTTVMINCPTVGIWFTSCFSSIKDLTLGDAVTSISRAFYYFSNLTSIKVDEENAVFDSRNNCNAIIETTSNTLIAGCKETVIPNSVTGIGDGAFYSCSGLTSITIPESVTSIGGAAFYGCSGLTSITIPESVTSIGGGAFYGCSGLSSITIPESVISIGQYAFHGCSGLTFITIHSRNISYISQGSFAGCENLKDFYYYAKRPAYTLKSAFGSTPIQTATLHVPGHAIETYRNQQPWSDFGNIVALTEEVCPDAVRLKAKNYTRVYGDENPEFDYEVLKGTITSGTPIITCAATKESPVGTYDIVISEGTVDNNYVGLVNGTLTITKAPLKIIAGNYAKLLGEENPEFKPIYSGFKNGEKKDVLTTTPTVTTTATTLSPIGTYPVTASGASATNYDISYVDGTLTVAMELIDVKENIKFADPLVKEICVANWDQDEDGELSIDEAEAVTDIGQVFYQSKIQSFDELRFFTGLRGISYNAFYYCMNLTSITIPKNVISIGSFAFYGCMDLSSIFIPKAVTRIDYFAFHECNLTSIVVEEGNTVFDSRNGCNALISTASNVLLVGCQNTIIPKDIIYIEDRAFANCRSLTSISIPNSVTYIGNGAFADCVSLTSITIPKSVDYISYTTFMNCTSLASIVVEDGNTIFDSRNDCNAIIYTDNNILKIGCKNTVIPKDVTSISGNAFYGCSGLTSIVIPESVTSIGMYAFANCDGLTSITIPKSVTTIGEGAFQSCNNLSHVYCYAEQVPRMESTAIEYVPVESATLHVPANAIEDYRNTAPWSSFGTIVALTDEETGIEQIDNGQLTMDNEAGTWYTLDGKKLNSKPDTKGIFIRNGKKVLVK